jgi:hypothetical protein
MANLAFLGAKANRRILASRPETYLPNIDADRLRAQYVPMDSALWDVDRYEDFLAERRRLLTQAMNAVLEE